jgi:uncharacterized protein YlaI
MEVKCMLIDHIHQIDDRSPRRTKRPREYGRHFVTSSCRFMAVEYEVIESASKAATRFEGKMPDVRLRCQ